MRPITHIKSLKKSIFKQLLLFSKNCVRIAFVKQFERTIEKKMDIFKKVLVGIYLAVSAILILVVTFQAKESENSAEDTYENSQYNKFFDKNIN